MTEKTKKKKQPKVNIEAYLVVVVDGKKMAYELEINAFSTSMQTNFDGIKESNVSSIKAEGLIKSTPTLAEVLQKINGLAVES